MAAGQTFQVMVDWKVKDLGPVFREAVNATAKTIRERSRQDVAGGLHNAGRFVKGTNTKVEKIEGGYAIDVIQRPAFAKVWETGGISRGKPFLWLPAPGNRVKLRNYKNKLIRPKGKRVLISAIAGTPIRGVAGSGALKRGQVRYVGVTSITNRKRFHLETIAFEEANRFYDHWSSLLRA
jgi:hypothetical protein